MITEKAAKPELRKVRMSGQLLVLFGKYLGWEPLTTRSSGLSGKLPDTRRFFPVYVILECFRIDKDRLFSWL